MLRRTRMPHGPRGRHAAVAAEFAILLPFLALLFAAIIDFGRIFFVTQALEHSAFAGALYASGSAQAASSTGAVQAARNAACASAGSLDPPLQPEQVTITLPGNGTARVTVAYDFPLVTPILGPSSTVHLERTVTLHVAPVPGQ